MKISILPDRFVLSSPSDDFFKMFFPTILVALSLVIIDITRFEAVLFVAFYFLDAGHIYSSFIELFFDKNENRTKKMLLISLSAILLNLFVTYAFPGNFFVYLFYFTIFHNLRQGLGVFLIYFSGSSNDRSIQKYLYYFGTVIPVALFHFRNFHMGSDSTYTLRPYDFSSLLSTPLMTSIFSLSSKIYFVLYLAIIIYLIAKKQKAIFSFIFFTLIYSVSFLIFENVVWAMLLLVTSHAIPYFFIFNKRISLTHSSNFIRKHSTLFVFLFFVIGAVFELTQEDVSGIFQYHMRNIVFSIVFYPMTVHYIFDSFIWKKGDKKYEVFKQSISEVSKPTISGNS